MYSFTAPVSDAIPIHVYDEKRTHISGVLVNEMALWPGSDWWYMTDDQGVTVGFWFTKGAATEVLQRLIEG